MSLSDEAIHNGRRFDSIIMAIQQRVINIAKLKTRLRVLSIHPSSLLGNSEQEVTLRLALRPDRVVTANAVQESPLPDVIDSSFSDPGVVVESSLEARLADLGLTYSFKLNTEIEKEVDALVKRVKVDVPRALELSTSPKVVFIDPAPRGVKIVAALLSLLLPFLVIFYWTSLTQALIATSLFVAASSIYKLITFSFRSR
jgi:hypothetical protein